MRSWNCVLAVVLCIALVGCTASQAPKNSKPLQSETLTQLLTALNTPVSTYTGSGQYTYYSESRGSESWNVTLSVRYGTIIHSERTLGDGHSPAETADTFNSDAEIKRQLIQAVTTFRTDTSEAGNDWVYDAESRCYTATRKIALMGGGYSPVSQGICFDANGLVVGASWDTNVRVENGAVERDFGTYSFGVQQDIAVVDTPESIEAYAGLIAALDTPVPAYSGVANYHYVSEFPQRHGNGFEEAAKTRATVANSVVTAFTRDSLHKVNGIGDDTTNHEEMKGAQICSSKDSEGTDQIDLECAITAPAILTPLTGIVPTCAADEVGLCQAWSPEQFAETFTNRSATNLRYTADRIGNTAYTIVSGEGDQCTALAVDSVTHETFAIPCSQPTKISYNLTAASQATYGANAANWNADGWFHCYVQERSADAVSNENENGPACTCSFTGKLAAEPTCMAGSAPNTDAEAKAQVKEFITGHNLKGWKYTESTNCYSSDAINPEQQICFAENGLLSDATWGVKRTVIVDLGYGPGGPAPYDASDIYTYTFTVQ